MIIMNKFHCSYKLDAILIQHPQIFSHISDLIFANYFTYVPSELKICHIYMWHTTNVIKFTSYKQNDHTTYIRQNMHSFIHSIIHSSAAKSLTHITAFAATDLAPGTRIANPFLTTSKFDFVFFVVKLKGRSILSNISLELIQIIFIEVS